MRSSLTIPIFFLLLPVFFVLHGMQENAGLIPFRDALLLSGIYLISALVLYAFCWWLFRDRNKAALGSFLLMAVHFFFGGAHDLLKKVLGENFITRYSVILPVVALLVIVLFILLKKRKRPLRRTSTYLNLLMLILIAWDCVLLFASGKEQRVNNSAAFRICDTCSKPDIYLILLDEYTGHVALKDLFQFDNSAFEQQLRAKGFHVVNNSRSNYNYTPFSMASMLNMEYLQLKDTERQKPDLTLAFDLINTNRVRQILEANGYRFLNHSVFNLPDQPAPIEETFIPAKTRLITEQTLLSRLQRDLGYHLITTFKIKAVINRQAYRELRNNTKLYSLTELQAREQSTQPRFIYTHLMMPHYPYYFDRNGKPMDPQRVLPEANNVNRKDYVEYLQYVNNKILALATHILNSSKTPPVIMIMGDHGFRHFKQPVDKKYYFMNLNAVYLPGGNYGGFYDGFSNVNQFRVIFNTMFGAGYPMLADSSVYLKD